MKVEGDDPAFFDGKTLKATLNAKLSKPGGALEITDHVTGKVVSAVVSYIYTDEEPEHFEGGI